MPLNPQELASTVEALHDAVLRRLSWSVYETYEQPWRSRLSVDGARTIIDSLVSSYAKAMMAFKEADFDQSSAFLERFEISDEIWNVLATVSKAKHWNDVPFHSRHEQECPVCNALRR